MGPRIVKFGTFQANLDSAELYRDGIRLKLGGQPFQVLETLLSRPGDVVTREELRLAVWQSETFVDFDQGLNTAINKLREALCDTASNPRFVETVPRRGYRFIAPVSDPSAAPSETTAKAPAKPSTGRWATWATVATVLVLTAAATSTWLYFQRAPAPSPAAVPFTTLPGAEYSASFSPDGTQVVFFWVHPDSSKSGIYIKSIHPDSEKVTPLVVKEPYFNYSPAWSPDGKSIAFLRRTPEAETWIHLIAPTGGPDRRLIRLSSSMELLRIEQHLSWGPDGQWLLAPIVPSGTSQIIHRISINGDARPVTDPGSLSFFGRVAPDGRAFVFHSRTGTPRTSFSEIFLQRLNPDGLPEGTPQVIGKAEGGARGLAWAPNGNAILSCAEHVGVGLRLFRIPVRAGGMTPISSNDCASLTVSRPDSSGKAMLLYGTSSVGAKARMWQARLDSMTDASELSPSSRSDYSPAFSPDGASVAFVSYRSGQPEIWVVGLDGREATRITNNAQVRGRPDWSPDGSRFVYGTANFTPFGSAIVPVTGGPSIKLPAGSQTLQPIWSRDGKFVYYTTGHQLWRMRPDGGEPPMLIEGDRYLPVGESPDGGRFYCTRRGNPHSIYRISRNGGPADLIEEGIATPPAVTAAKRALYFIRDKDSALYRLPFHGGPAKRLGILPRPPGGASSTVSGLTVSPDDTRIVWATSDQQIDLALIRDFQ